MKPAPVAQAHGLPRPHSCGCARFALLVLPALLSAAVTGTVINRTTGQPQAGATVGLNRLGQNGIELIDQAKSDAQGHFTINQQIQGPHLLRTAFDGVTYNHMLPPGTPSTDVTVDVFNASKLPGEAKVTKHMLFFEPSGSGQMTVQETYLFTNAGKTAWNDPDNGELRFYLPAAAEGKAQVIGTAPGGMGIPAALVKTSSPDVRAVDFAIKPGETRFDVTYALPYTAGAPFEGKIVTKDENTYLIAPVGVTLAGDGLTDMGAEPRTQAHIFGLPATAYKITLTGAAAPPPDADTSAGADQEGAPRIEVIMPRIYDNAKIILVLALAILAVGFILLYRKSSPVLPAAKEANERGRR
jgi:hypothetical protein